MVSVIKSNCHILQFLHQMFNVSSLLLDGALLKCVVIEVALFSVVDFNFLSHWYFTRCGGGIFICSPDSDTDSEISLKICQYLTKLRHTLLSVPAFGATLYFHLLQKA